MNMNSPRRYVSGFTLIEMLVVIAIIAVLAGLIIPAAVVVKENARRTQAATEARNLAAAITAYQAKYGLYPCSAADAQLGGDRTYTNDNSATMIILLDAGADVAGGPNENHKRNPEKHVFFNAKQAQNNTSPGLGSDYNFRDPWGRPYVITLDLNYDNKCTDDYYGEVPVPVAVWSMGKDGIPNPGQPKGDVKGW